ncbi:MAG: helix-turn-helix domain-containing protein, partial [Candidatus Nitrosopolaris sp.]
RMIIEPECSGKTVSDVCIAFGVSRETWYKWKRRYDAYGIDGLKNQSRKPHNIKYVKVTEELVKIILELQLNSRFGPSRIRFSQDRFLIYLLHLEATVAKLFLGNIRFHMACLLPLICF